MFGKFKLLTLQTSTSSLGPPREKMLSMLQILASNFGMLKIKNF
jgi:hypothetical protein